MTAQYLQEDLDSRLPVSPVQCQVLRAAGGVSRLWSHPGQCSPPRQVIPPPLPHATIQGMNNHELLFINDDKLG